MKRILVATVLLPLAAVVGLCDCANSGEDSGDDPAWPLAVRFRSYGDYAEAAWTHLPEIGIKYVFLSVPKPDEVDATMQKLKAHGLTPVVMRGDADLTKETFAEEIGTQSAVCKKMGVKYIFLSAKRKETPKDVTYARLRAAGDAAKRHGVIVALETHPDLGTNGAVQIETMQAVNHPNIRVNFDTANVTYYNKDTSGLAEMTKSIGFVATVEFKDHSCEFETWDFPVVGQGKVDFPGIVKLLQDNNYAGPVTIEFEGTKGVELTEEETKKAIADSVAYVRTLGNFDVGGRPLKFPDLLMIVGYFVLMLGIGAYFYGRMRRMKDYFSGGNTIPWWLSGVSFYMSSFSVAAFVFYPSVCYRFGWVGVTLLWVAVPATIFSATLFAGRWRRARVDSPVEYLETRYSPLLRQLFAWQGVPVRLIDDAIKLVAVAGFISICVGVDMRISVVVAGILILAYTLMGGLWAVAVTDFIQFVVLTVAILVILPLSILRGGGIAGIIERVPEGFFNLTSPEFDWAYVLPLILLYALAWSSINWSLIQRYYCVPTERDAVKVGALVAVLYVIGPPLMFFPAIAATQFIPTPGDTGHIYPLLCAELLPAGMLGLAVAAMFAATMSSLSSEYNVCASVLTNDVYKRFIRPKASQRQLVNVGRLMTLLVGLVALAVALIISTMSKSEGLFKIMVTLFSVATAPVAVPMLLGFVSRRVTNLAAVLGFVLGLSVGLGLFALSQHDEEIALLGIRWVPLTEDVVFGSFAMKMEIVTFLANTLVTLGVCAVVSLLWPHSTHAQSRVDEFLRRLATPIGELPEDEDGATESDIQSPFRLVGISILLIGVLLFAVLPWVRDSQTLVVLDALLAVVLMVAGGLMAWASGRSPSTE